MPAKKSAKPVKKPAKAPVRKPVAKTAPARKPARAAHKASGKGLAVKSAAKPAKAPAKAAPAVAKPAPKPAPAKAPRVKPAPAAAAAAPAPKTSAARARPAPMTTRPMYAERPLEEDPDAEPGTSASLLAGPRNVKPYIPRRGEQYMNKEQLGHFAQILQNWKRDLMVEVDRTVLHMKDEAANFPDPNDRATQEEEFSLELRTRDRERKLIRKIDEALKRIEDGNYGYCLETGEEIGIKRLEARPVATLSVEAQERRERREKQYGDRDDRYR
jgi:DnaK suppressor protein